MVISKDKLKYNFLHVEYEIGLYDDILTKLKNKVQTLQILLFPGNPKA